MVRNIRLTPHPRYSPASLATVLALLLAIEIVCGAAKTEAGNIYPPYAIPPARYEPARKTAETPHDFHIVIKGNLGNWESGSSRF